MFAFLGRLIQVLFVLLVVRLLLRGVASLVRRPGPARRAPGARAGELVRDRVCNTFVPKDRALREVVGGHSEYFCSARCRDLALAGAKLAG